MPVQLILGQLSICVQAQVQNRGNGHQLVRLWLWRCRQFVPSSMALPKMTFLPTLQPKYASGHILENIGFSFNLNLSVYDKANSWNFELAWVVTQPMVTLQGQWWRIQNRWYERTSQLYGKWKRKKWHQCVYLWQANLAHLGLINWFVFSVNLSIKLYCKC